MNKIRAFLLLWIVLIFCPVLAEDVSAQTVTVRFGTISSGKWVNTYPDKAKKVTAGTKLRLPNMTAKNCIYAWGVSENGKIQYYDVNTIVTVNKNTYYFLKSFRPCTLRFYTANGKSEFTQYRKRVRAGVKVKLPDVFYSGGVLLTGWCSKFGVTKPMYQPGETLTVKGDMKFYRTGRSPQNAASEKNGKLIYLMYKNGSLYKTLKRTSASIFPDYRPTDGSTMMGWSRQAGKSCGAAYLPGETVPSDASIYYMVLSTRQDDAKYNTSIPKSKRFGKVIFVGDSRMVHTRRHFGTQKPVWMDFVVGSAQGYNWLSGNGLASGKTSGYIQLLQKVKAYYKSSKGKKIAVVFNLGVNDLGNLNSYIAFYKKIAPELKKYNCTLFFMSVNPCNKAMTDHYIKILFKRSDRHGREPLMVKKFNNSIRRSLKGMYTYIDCFNYLQSSGWFSANVYVHNYPDGVHYSKNTSMKIVQYVMKTIG